jgi:FG-GAP repeat
MGAAILLLLLLGGELEAPVRLESLGKPIDVLGGHAAPAVADVDGDGIRDLLVGQFLGEGRNLFHAPARLYRGPKLESLAYLEGVSVPSG